MITRLYVDNFRCLVNFELTLDQINLFLGANGSGKTSVFEVLRRLQLFVVGDAKVSEVFKAEDLSSMQTRDEQRFELELDIDGETYVYALTIVHDRGRRRALVKEETLKCEGQLLFSFRDGLSQLHHPDFQESPQPMDRRRSGIAGTAGTSGFAGTSGSAGYPLDPGQSGIGRLPESNDNDRMATFKEELTSLIIVRPCPPIFESEARSEPEFLDPLMKNFVGWYRNALQENTGALIPLFRELGEALPGFDSLSLVESGEGIRALKVAFLNSTTDQKFNRYGFGQLSDGQRALIALYSLLYLRGDRRVSLFIDEPDNYFSLREVQPWLVHLVDACSENLEQAILISHHSITIDCLAGSYGKWFYREAEGPTRVTDEPKAMSDGTSISETIARGWEE